MQGRFALHMKALMFSLTTVGCGFLLTFFFYDGPSPTSLLRADLLPVATAQATEAPDEAQAPNPKSDPVPPVFSGFQAQWKTLSLDQGQMSLKVLAKPLPVAQSEGGLGTEAYDYAAYLFDQMGGAIRHEALASRLKTLSLQAQTMGNTVRQAGSISFSGPPTPEMTHLQAKSSIQFYLASLNSNALVTARYNGNGRLLSEEKANPRAGQNLNAFLKTVDQVLSDPAARNYPQAMALVKAQRDRLQALSEHLSLRWESTEKTIGKGGPVVTNVRIYLRQTMPGQKII